MTRGRDNFPATARGFTLMELVLVMLILAIVAAVSAPNLRNFIAGRRAGDTAAQIVALAQFARSQAIAEGRVYQLEIDTSSGMVSVSYRNAANEVQPAESDVGAPVRLPGTVGQLRMDSDLPVGDQGVHIAHFYPTGRVEPGSITVTDDRNQEVKIVCESPSENYHIPPKQAVR
jgi:prepilin-type N-terminal cleavage/methylation domain-containing protein